MALRDLLAEPSLNLRLCMGEPDALQREIRWVSVTELDDPSPFLNGGELVLTTGLRHRTAAAQAAFVQRLAAAQVTGIGFGTGLSHQAVPKGLLSAARTARIPVIEVPYETPFIAIDRYVADKIFEAYYRRQRELVEAHDTLSRALLSGQGLQALLRELHRMLGSPVSVIDYHGSILASEPQRAAWPVEQILRARRCRGRKAGGPPSVTVDPIQVEDTVVAFLCTRDAGDKAHILPYALSLIGLELARRQAVLRGRRELAGQVVEDIVNSSITNAEAERRLKAFGVDATGSHTVLVGAVDCEPQRLRSLPWSIYPLTHSAEEPHLSALVGRYLTVIVAAGQPVHDIAHMMREHLMRIGTDARVGIGGCYPGVNGLRWSFFEAREALSRGPGVHEREPLTLSTLLLSNRELPLKELGQEMLRPLLDFDEVHGGRLIETLQTFFEADGSVQQVAERLFVHRNTVRYRLAQIEQLTGRSLASMQHRTQLWLALQAMRLG
ncbi:hypothetical protein LI90_1660 [Carbonactinospora thermoautotrophica]|uniref:PucR family transcriptional regulator n=1 Tax=Carbonactinospora thermoautotrophica TaxID=1469144 RepID=A0A132MRZ4_9ACTN|nr:hypothetical protein LI90_1660 [Carbonactinospora thermoautotrophica]